MIKVRYEGGDLLVSLFQVNKLNTLLTDVVEKQLAELLTANTRKVYFDLSKIKFIDSSGFDMILRIVEKSKVNGSDFILCNITDEVEELVNLLRIGNKLTIVHKKFESESLLQEVE